MLHSAAIQDKFLVEIVESEKVTDFKSWCGQFYKKKNVISTETQARNILKERKKLTFHLLWSFITLINM
jgi:hypothetical protein